MRAERHSPKVETFDDLQTLPNGQSCHTEATSPHPCRGKASTGIPATSIEATFKAFFRQPLQNVCGRRGLGSW